jgi:DNA-binding transcriptional LysR family regulator
VDRPVDGRDLTANRAMVLGGHGVTLVPGLLTDHLHEVVLKPLRPAGPSRDVYVLLPPGGRHPLVPAALDALRTAADARTGPGA